MNDRLLMKWEMERLLKEGEYLFDESNVFYNVDKGLKDSRYREREGILLVGERIGTPDGKVYTQVTGFHETSVIRYCTNLTPRQLPLEEDIAREKNRETTLGKYVEINLHTHTLDEVLDPDAFQKGERKTVPNDRPSTTDIAHLLVYGRFALRRGEEYVMATVHIPTEKKWALKLNTKLFTRQHILEKLDGLEKSYGSLQTDEAIRYALVLGLVEYVDVKEGPYIKPAREIHFESEAEQEKQFGEYMRNIQKAKKPLETTQQTSRVIRNVVIFISLISLLSIFSIYNQSFSPTGQEILFQRSNYSIAGLFSLIVAMVFIFIFVSRKKN